MQIMTLINVITKASKNHPILGMIATTDVYKVQHHADTVVIHYCVAYSLPSLEESTFSAPIFF